MSLRWTSQGFQVLYRKKFNAVETFCKFEKFANTRKAQLSLNITFEIYQILFSSKFGWLRVWTSLVLVFPEDIINVCLDPYVKIYMNYQNVRSVKKKTHIKKRSLNPVFNESFIFDLPSKEGSLEDIQLEIIMSDWDRITKNEAS